MELASVHTPVAALVAGLVTSLHCAGMCGPLACVFVPVRGGSTHAATAYHLTRLTSYSLLGAMAGGLGRSPLSLLNPASMRLILPWALVVLFVALALRADRWLRRSTVLGKLFLRLGARAQALPAWAAAAVLGAGTPLLPCGPLYFLLAVALLSGSALKGAEFMLAFGLGTIPLLWLVQSRVVWFRSRLSPAVLARVQRSLALASALIVAWRLRSTLGLPGPDVAVFCCF